MSSKNFKPPTENKLLGLEIMRFFSALSILILHYQNFGYGSNISADFVREKQPLYTYLKIFYDQGHFAVYIFFCISGFIFFWKYRETICNKTVNGKQFFVARFARLYPLHFVTLMLAALAQLIHLSINDDFFIWKNNDFFHFTLQLFMASDWGFQKGPSFNTPIWSISLEILVYFLFFLILRYISKSILVNIMLVIFCLIARAYEIPYTGHPIVACIGLFYIGGISAIILKFVENTKYKQVSNGIVFFLLILAPIIIWQLEIYTLKNFNKIFIFFYTPTLLYILSQYVSNKPAIQKSIEIAGNLTYSSYLIHIPFQIFVVILFSLTSTKIPVYNVFFFFLYILLTLIISYLIYRYFEAPSRRYFRLKFSN